MLIEQTPVGETVSIAIDTLPLGLLISEDGHTLLVTDHENDGLEWILPTPVAFIQQNNAIISPQIKVTNSNTPMNSSVFHVNFDTIIAPTNTQQPLLYSETQQQNNTVVNIVNSNEIAKKQNEYDSNNRKLLSSSKTSSNIVSKDDKNKQETIRSEPLIRKLNTIPKRAPGRPRKDLTNPAEQPEKICDICGEKFKKQMLFRKHMDDHAEEKPHRCPKCPASFNIPTNFTLHMATHNTGELKCPECDRKFARMASLKSHMLHHQKEEHLFCTECEDAFPTKAQLDSHLRLHNEKWSSDDVKKCKLCNKQFSQPALYRVHIRDHYKLQTKIMKHTKRGPTHKTLHKCRICLKIFQKPSQLMRHIRVHTGERPFKCNVCDRAFTQKSSLQIHKWKHVGVRPFTCIHCNAKFSQKGNLNSHVAKVHIPPEGGGPVYSCMLCSCVFKRLSSLTIHMKKMHSYPIEKSKCDSSTEMNKDENKCDSSIVNSSAKINADSIDAESNNQEKSDILQEALTKSGLSSKEKNTITVTGTAEEVKENFDTSYVTLLDRSPDGALRRYITIKQRNIGHIKWYACNYCHKEFKKPSDLIRHLRVHTQEKPYKCPHCYRSFALKSTMLAHQRTHAGVKKYTCGVCGKKFACHTTLNAHTSSAHAKQNKCNICDKTFNTNNLLKSHMKTHMKTKTKISPDAEALIPKIILEEPLMISDAGNKISVAHIQSKQKQTSDDSDDNGRPHKCWVCPAAFRKISHLKQHYRRHTGERPFKCSKCDRRFTSNSVLKAHLQTHEKSRPYNCNVCNAKFSTQSSMKRHLVTHSNKRPFMCPYCHKTFKTTVNCRKHMKIHRTELAQQQLEKEKIQISTDIEKNPSISTGINEDENLNLHDDISNTFQENITTDFSQAFNDQLTSMVAVDKNNLSGMNIVNVTANTITENLSTVNGGENLETTQTLHADETGTITLPNYTGDQTLTQESIREIEETLNQQLFNIGMNMGLGNNLSRQINVTNGECLSEERDPPVLNIIYENPKEMNHNQQSTSVNSINSNIFPPNFDTFDISQITLQADTEIDLGINAANSTSMASILPRSAQEGQHLVVPITTGNNNQLKDNTQQLVVVNNSLQAFQQQLTKIPSTILKYPKIIAKADTTNDTETLNSQQQQQQQNVTIEQNENLMCHYCDKIFKQAHDLKVHIVLTHVTNNIKITNDNDDNYKQENELLQCHMCYKKGFNTLTLKEHLTTHRGAKEFQCTKCHLKFCTNGGLSRHLKMHAAKSIETCWTCTQCFATFSNELQLKLHEKTHSNSENITGQTIDWRVTKIEPDSSQQIELKIDPELLAVNESGVTVSEKILLNVVDNPNYLKSTDNQLLLPKVKKEYDNKCEYCPKTFRKPSDLIRHVRTHTGERPYRCEYCYKSFAVKCTLDCHLKVHTGNEKFCCNVCSRLFATKGSLKVHMRLHTGSKPFKCLICDSRFRTSGHRKVHLLTHMRENKNNDVKNSKKTKIKKLTESINIQTPSPSLQINEKSSDNSTNIGVNNTAQVIVNTSNLSQTTDYQNLDAITIDATGISDQLTFNPDGTILNNNSVLSVNESNQLVADLHFLIASGFVTIQTDENLLPQLHCSDTNINQDQSTAHALSTTNNLEQSENNVVIATQIGNIQKSQQHHEQQSSTQLQLNEVMRLVEMQTVNSVSQIPSSDVQTVATITKSNGKVQMGKNQSKNECNICRKSFMKPCQLERHKRIHTGERPFKCELCAKSFAQKVTLQIHEKHHTGDRPHSCPHCDYSFTQKGNLQTHLKRVHQLETIEGKKLRRNQHIMSAKLYHDSNNTNLNDNRIPNLDDLSFVELLK